MIFFISFIDNQWKMATSVAIFHFSETLHFHPVLY